MGKSMMSEVPPLTTKQSQILWWRGEAERLDEIATGLRGRVAQLEADNAQLEKDGRDLRIQLDRVLNDTAPDENPDEESDGGGTSNDA